MNRFRKILILGSNYFNICSDKVSVESLRWKDLKKLRNIEDYDSVIFDFLESPDLSGLEAGSFFTPQHCWRMMAAGGEILILGDPRTPMPTGDLGAKPFSLRTGLSFKWGSAPGTIISIASSVAAPMHRYLDTVREWEWAITGLEQSSLPNIGEELRWRYETMKLAANRLGDAIAVSFQLILEEQRFSGYGMQWVHRADYGSLTLLPRSTMRHEETLQYILQEFMSVCIAEHEPTWAATMEVPGEHALIERISSQEEILNSSMKALGELREERNAMRRVIRLLYDGGEELEKVVRTSLAELGAVVTVPDEKGKADGFVSVDVEGKNYRGVLEIKGVKGDSFSQDGLKQLSGWMHDAVETYGIEYKGIFVGNFQTKTPPFERGNPFSDNWTKTAQIRKIAAVTTQNLYDALISFKQGTLRKDDFWRSLFATDGIWDPASIAPLGLPPVPTH